MLASLHRCVGLENLPIRSNHVGHPLGAPRVGAVARPVRRTYLPVGIAQQRIGKPVLLCKSSIRLHAVCTHPEDLNLFRLIVTDSITESDPFSSSAARTGPGIKPEHHGPPTIVAECYLSTGVIFH